MHETLVYVYNHTHTHTHINQELTGLSLGRKARQGGYWEEEGQSPESHMETQKET